MDPPGNSSFWILFLLSKLQESHKTLSASKREISNPDTLTRIVDYFNDSEKTPIKFLPTCKFILLHLDEKEEVVFVSGQSLKYNGVTYKSSKNIEQIIVRWNTGYK